MLASIIADVVYGRQVHTMEDEFIQLSAKSVEVSLETNTIGNYWIDFLPVLRHIPHWVPGAAAAKYAARWRPVVLASFNQPFDAVKNDPVCLCLPKLYHVAN